MSDHTGLRAVHVTRNTAGVPYCDHDGQRWPCDAAKLLDAYDAIAQELATERAHWATIGERHWTHMARSADASMKLRTALETVLAAVQDGGVALWPEINKRLGELEATVRAALMPPEIIRADGSVQVGTGWPTMGEAPGGEPD